jgi:hypothetical protein
MDNSKTKDSGGDVMKDLSKFICTFSIIIFLTGNSFAQFKTLSLTSGKGYRQFPSSAESMMNGHSDGTIICWLDDEQGGSLKVQKVLIDGSIAWPRGGVIADKDLGSVFSAEDDYPMTFTDGSGGSVIIYRKHDEIQAIWISAAGVPDRDPAILSSYFDGLNFSPKAEQGSDLEITVVWENFYQGDFNIHAQRLDRFARKLWQNGNELQVVRHPDDQRKPEIGIFSNADIIITWLDTRNIGYADSGSYDTYGILFDENGNFKSKPGGERIHRQKLPHNIGSLFQSEESGSRNSSRKDYGIEKIKDYNHKPIISGNDFFIATEEGFLDNPFKVNVWKFSRAFELISKTVIKSESIEESPSSISDGDDGIIVFWKCSTNKGHTLHAKRITENGKSYDGHASAIKLTCELHKSMKGNSMEFGKRPAFFDRENQKFILPWLAQNNGQLLTNDISLTDESEACTGLQLVNQGLTSEGHTSVTSQAGNLVIAYNLAQDICVSIRELSRDPKKQNVHTDKIANFPNPFNPITSINFNVPSDGFVKLSVFDVTGRIVSVLVNEYRKKGEQMALFDGSGLASGTYVYKLETGGSSWFGKMVMMK